VQNKHYKKMFKQTPKIPKLITRASLVAILIVVAVTSFAINVSRGNEAAAATSSTINFQARLLTATGSVVPDGLYNVEFKLYDTASTGGTSQGSCSSNCVWMETRTSGNRVRVVNGYLTVNLGSVTAFGGSINWDQELWLTMNVGGTGSPSFDGEMSPRLKLTAVPYALRAGKLVGGSGSNVTTLDAGTPSGNNTIHLPAESGTLCIQSSSNCGFATSSGSGNYIQNGTSMQTAANFYIQSAANNSVGGIIRGASGQTSSLFQLLDGSSGYTVAQFSNNGYLSLGSDNIVRGGQITLNDTTTGNTFTGTINTPAAFGANRTITLPDESGTICIQSSASCGFATSSGSGNYIQNGTTVQTAANFAIRSAATGSVGAVIQGANGQSVDIFRIQTWNGTTATSVITVSNTGLLTASAGINVTSGVTATGTISLNASSNNNTSINTGTSTGTVTIGGGSAPLVIDSTNFDVSSAGAVSGVTTITTSGNINGQTISTAANFTGSMAIQGNTTLGDSVANDTLTVNATLQGGTPLVFEGASADANETSFNITDPTADRTVTFGDEGGTVCLQNSANCGFALSSGSGNYIQNGTAVQAANYAIRSAATGNVTAVIQGANGQSADILQIQTWNGTSATSVVAINNTGLLTASAGLTVTNGFTATGAVSINASSNSNTNINTGTSSGTITIGGGSAPLVIDSTNFDVTSGGAVSGVSTITTSGNINSQTISSAANFTGTVTIQGGSALTLGTSSSNTGTITFRGSGGVGTLTLAGPTTPNTGNYTLSIPAITANANVCTDNAVCSGYAAASGSGNYIQNGTTVQTANYAIRSNAIGSVTGVIQGANGQTADIFRIQTWNGTTATSVVAVSNAGLLTASAGINVTSGVTATGTISLNASSNNNTSINTGTSTGTVTIGGGSAPLVIDSTNFDVSSAGALSGVTTITTSGNINSQTISSAANFTGTVTIQGSNSLTLGTSTTNTGSIILRGSGNSGTLTIAGPNSPNVGNYTVTIPAVSANANFCTDNSVCSGYAPASGSANYIQNGTTVQAGANFAIRSSAIGNVGALVQGANGQTADLLQVQTWNGTTGTTVFGIGNTGNITATGTYNTNTFNSSTLTFGAAGTATISSAASQALTVTSNAAATWSTTNGNLSIQAQGNLNLGNAGGQTINMGTDNKAHTITIGNQSTTGAQTIVIGSNGNTGSSISLESGSASTLNIGAAASAHTINMGTGAAAQTIAIGSTNGASSLALSGGTADLTLNSSDLIVAKASTSFQVQDASNNTILAVDTSTADVRLGKASTTNGKLLFFNSTNANTVTLQSGVTTTGYTLTLPTALGSAGDCLKDSGSGALQFTACGNLSGSLQGAYNASIGSTTPEIIVDSTRGGVDIQDVSTPGSSLGANPLFAVRGQATASTLGPKIFSVQGNGRVAIGNITPGYALDVSGDINISTGSAYKINGIDICTSSGCTPAAGSNNYIQNGTSQQTANYNIVSSSASSIAAQIQGAASSTVPVMVVKGGATPGTNADLIQLQDSSSAVHFKVDNDGDTAISKSLKVGSTASMATSTLDVAGNAAFAVNNTTTSSQTMKIEQTGTGDTGIELKNTALSYYMGIDSSAGTFRISSSQASGSTVNLGYTAVGGNVDSGDRNFMNASKFTASATGTVSSISVYVASPVSGSPNNKSQVAIYSDSSGLPGSRLGFSNDAVVTGNSWNVINLTSGVSVTSGTVYWLAYNTNASTDSENNMVWANGTTNQTRWVAQTYGTWPASWSGGASGNGQFSIYAPIAVSGASDNLGGNLVELSGTGAASFKNSTNSTSAFQIQNASGTAFFNADSTNQRIGIGTSTPSYKLDVVGDVNISTGSAYKINGTDICTASGCTPNATSNSFIQNQNSSDQTANFRINGTGRASTSFQAPLFDTASAVALGIGTTNATVINLNENTTVAAGKTLTVTSANTSLTGATTGDALTVNNSTSTGNVAVFNDNGSAVFTIGDGGVMTAKTTSSTSNAFVIQNGSSQALFSTDTFNNTVKLSTIGRNNTSTYEAIWLQGSKNGITTLIGGNDSTAAYVANDFSGSIRFNGSGVAWGDFAYFPQGGGNGNNGQFRFSTTGSALSTTPNAKVGVGDIYVAGNAGIGTNSPSYKVDVAGDVNISTGSAYKINGTNICTSSGCTPAAGSANYIQNQSAVQQSSSAFWISGTGRVDGGVLTNNVTSNSGALILQAATNVVSLGGSDTLTANGGFSVLSGTNSNLNVRASGTGTLGLGTNGSNRISITSAGNTTITSGSTGVALVVSNSTSTGNILNLQSNTTNVLTVSNNGNVVIDGLADAAGAFQIIDGSGATLLNFDTTNGSMKINGTGTNFGGGRLYFGDQTWAYIGEYDTTDTDALGLVGENGIFFGGGTNTDALSLIDNDLNFQGNFTVENTAETKAYRFRTNGGSLDVESGAAALYFSTWTDTAFSLGQEQHIVMNTNGTMQFNAISQTTGAAYRNLCINGTNKSVTYAASTNCQASSQRYKKDIQNLTPSQGLTAIEAMRPVTYYYKEAGADTARKIGFIAEEMVNIVPEVVFYNTNGQIEGIDYQYLTANLVKAVQEQQDQINGVKNRQNSQQNLISQMRVDIDGLRQGLWDGGLVSNDTTFNSLVTFKGKVAFKSDATFEGNVSFKKKVTYSEDAAGTVTIPKGETEIEVKFKSPYAVVPRIALSADQFVTLKVSDKKKESFKINLRVPFDEDVVVDWVATQVEVASNPPADNP